MPGVETKIIVPQELTEYDKVKVGSGQIPKNELGLEIRGLDGKAYKYVKTHTDLAADALAANQMTVFQDTAANVASNKCNTVGVRKFAGIALCAVPKSTATDTYYCWVQKAGVHSILLNGDGDVVAGDLIQPDAGDVGAGNKWTAGTTDSVCAVALEDDNADGTLVTALIKAGY